MIFQRGKLDNKDVSILREISECGPRNLSEVSRNTCIPYTTVVDRVHKLYGRDVVYFPPLIDWPAIGLAYKMATVRTKPDQAMDVEFAFTKNPYILSWVRDGSTYLVDALEPQKIEASPRSLAFLSEKLERMKNSGTVRSSRIFEMEGFFYPCSFADYDDFQLRHKKGDLSWDLGRAENPSYYLKKTLSASSAFGLPRATREFDFDDKDAFLVSELMRNPTQKLSEMAKSFGTSVPVIKYHYDRLVECEALNGYGVQVKKFQDDDSYVFFPKFSSTKGRNRFLNASRDFSIVSCIGLVNDDQSLIVGTTVPKNTFIDLFSEMKKEGMIASENWRPLHFPNLRPSNPVLRYELFKNDKWIVNSSTLSAL